MQHEQLPRRIVNGAISQEAESNGGGKTMAQDAETN